MAIFRKEHLNPYLHELDSYYESLRQTAQGAAPNTNLAYDFNCTAEQFQREFTEIDLEKLQFAINHFKVTVDQLKTLKNLKLIPKHKG